MGENEFENLVCKILAILSQPQSFKLWQENIILDYKEGSGSIDH